MRLNQMRKTQMEANSTVLVRKIPGGLRIGLGAWVKASSLTISVNGTPEI